MARVLVVEDSPDQARMIAGLLESGGYSAEIAANGGDALARIREHPPDVVATDLIMPGINGLEVVEEVCRTHPEIPVILMTAFGSGEIARKALQHGAASYVPKRLLQEKLIRTVETTLRVARARREQARALECLVDSEHRFVLDNDESLIPPVVAYLQDAVRGALKDDVENQLVQLGIALQEALLNGMHHGNLEVPSEVREAGGEFYVQMIERRRNQAAYRDRRVHFTARVSRTELVCVVRDEGSGFDPASVPDPTDAENLEKVSGRGLFLIWTFMDEVEHNAAGNQITLVKRFAASGKESR